MFELRKTWPLLTLIGLVFLAGLLLGESRAQGVVVAEAPEVAHDVAYMGVQLEEETDHPEGGARVSEVVHDSPAEKAGLRADDIIVLFDGKVIRGPVGLTKQIHERKPGDTVTIGILRDGRKQSIEIELADRTSRYGSLGYTVAPFADMEFVTPEVEFEMQEKMRRSLERLEHLELPQLYGMTSCEEDEDCGDFFFRFRYSKIMRGLPAEHAGIQVGDLIIRIGGDPVGDVSDLRRAIQERAGETFAIEVIRDGKSLDLEVTLPETDEDEVSGPRAQIRRVPPVPNAPPVRLVPPAAPAMPDVVAPAAPVAPHSRRQVEAYERQRAQARAELANVREQVRASQEQARELARAEAEHARLAFREAAALQREESRRQSEEIRLLRERLRGAHGSV